MSDTGTFSPRPPALPLSLQSQSTSTLFLSPLCQAGTNSLATPNSSFGIPAAVLPPSENPRAPQISSAPLQNKTRVAARPSPNKWHRAPQAIPTENPGEKPPRSPKVVPFPRRGELPRPLPAQERKKFRAP